MIPKIMLEVLDEDLRVEVLELRIGIQFALQVQLIREMKRFTTPTQAPASSHAKRR